MNMEREKEVALMVLNSIRKKAGFEPFDKVPQYWWNQYKKGIREFEQERKGKVMKNAIWFSRHQPTADQLADAEKLGYKIEPEGIVAGKLLGAMELKNAEDVKTVITELFKQVEEYDASAIFGVPSTPILVQIATAGDPERSDNDIPFYAAWNVMRSVDGQKPTFTHKSWEFIGNLVSCRWK